MLNKSTVFSKFVLALIAVSLITVMIRLGFWQLDRAEFKLTKQTEINARINQPMRDLPESISANDWRYHQVKVKGEYQSELEFLVDNVVYQSVAGVDVITPLKIEGSTNLILVNRGWLAWGNDRTFLPKTDVPTGQVELTGLLIPAAEEHFYLKNPENSQERSQLWSQLDLVRFMSKVQVPVQPLILVLDQDQPGSYKHTWKKQDDSWINRHKAYAVQWFALAATLLLITLVLVYRNWIKKGNS